jgi:hypothetical protein
MTGWIGEVATAALTVDLINFVTGFGPYPDGLFTQSNYGIVTKTGFWLMSDPSVSHISRSSPTVTNNGIRGYQAYLFSFQNDSDIPAIVERLRALSIGMVIQNAPTIRNTLIDAAVYAPKSHYTSSKEVLSSEEIDEIAKKINVGRWNVYGAMYGPKPMRDFQWEVLKNTFMQVPRASVLTVFSAIELPIKRNCYRQITSSQSRAQKAPNRLFSTCEKRL